MQSGLEDFNGNSLFFKCTLIQSSHDNRVTCLYQGTDKLRRGSAAGAEGGSSRIAKSCKMRREELRRRVVAQLRTLNRGQAGVGLDPDGEIGRSAEAPAN